MTDYMKYIFTLKAHTDNHTSLGKIPVSQLLDHHVSLYLTNDPRFRKKHRLHSKRKPSITYTVNCSSITIIKKRVSILIIFEKSEN